MGLTTLPSTTTVDEVYETIQRDGGVILENFLDSKIIDALNADFDPLLEKTGWGGDDFLGNKTRRLAALFKHSSHVSHIVEQPLYHNTAERFLKLPSKVWYGEEESELIPSMQIGVTIVIDINPGEGAQPLHRDDAVWQWTHNEGGGGRQARVQIMVALTDFTAENGATLVIPGSHLWGDDRAPKESEAVSAVMAKGSALIWIGSTYHGGGTNRSKSARKGLTVSLDLGFLRQEENHYIALGEEVVMRYPLKIQKLLGYAASPPLLGWIEYDGNPYEPYALLGGKKPEGGVAAGFTNEKNQA